MLTDEQLKDLDEAEKKATTGYRKKVCTGCGADRHIQYCCQGNALSSSPPTIILEPGSFELLARNNMRALIDEVKELRVLAADHMRGAITQSLAFDEIDRIKSYALRSGLKWNEADISGDSLWRKHNEENERLRAELQGARDLLNAADHELGVPQPGYPAPVANASGFIQMAIKRIDDSGLLKLESHEYGCREDEA